MFFSKNGKCINKDLTFINFVTKLNCISHSPLIKGDKGGCIKYSLEIITFLQPPQSPFSKGDLLKNYQFLPRNFSWYIMVKHEFLLILILERFCKEIIIGKIRRKNYER